MQTVLTDAERDLIERYSPSAQRVGLATILDNLINGQYEDPGQVAVNVLRVAANVADQETVVIGDDTFEIVQCQTDSGETSGTGLTNTTDPVALTFAAHGLGVGDLVLAESEIMKVLAVPDANTVVLKRGHSGTTAASHGDVALYTAAQVKGTGNIAVGLAATLTPAAGTDALIDVINSDGTQAVTAVDIGDNEVVIHADQVGAVALACTETLAGANNVWAAATMFGGGPVEQRSINIQKRVPTATEVALGNMHFMFDFAPTVLGVFVYVTATPGVAVAWAGGVTVTGNRVTLDNGGGTDWSASDTVLLIVAN